MFVSACWFMHVGLSLYLFSVEQKKVTHGLRTLLSVEGGRYMASEKQVSNNLSSSALKVEKHRGRTKLPSKYSRQMKKRKERK